MAYWALVSAGGAGERNCDAESSTNGVIDPTHGVWADWADGGGANTHVPGGCGATPNGVETGASRPSSEP